MNKDKHDYVMKIFRVDRKYKSKWTLLFLETSNTEMICIF